MSAFPLDFESRSVASPSAPEKAERRKPLPRTTDSKKTSWFYVFEKWISVPASEEDEFVLA